MLWLFHGGKSCLAFVPGKALIRAAEEEGEVLETGK